MRRERRRESATWRRSGRAARPRRPRRRRRRRRSWTERNVPRDGQRLGKTRRPRAGKDSRARAVCLGMGFGNDCAKRRKRISKVNPRWRVICIPPCWRTRASRTSWRLCSRTSCETTCCWIRNCSSSSVHSIKSTPSSAKSV